MIDNTTKTLLIAILLLLILGALNGIKMNYDARNIRESEPTKKEIAEKVDEILNRIDYEYNDSIGYDSTISNLDWE